MSRITVKSKMPAPADEVFEVLHDYEHRQEWDPVLRETRLTGGLREPKLGAKRHSRAAYQLGNLEVDEEYVTFHPGELAALRMLNHPSFLESFGSCTRHKNTPGGSVAIYSANFHTKPKWLRPVMEPLASAWLMFEARRHLNSLAKEVQRRQGQPFGALPAMPVLP
jgi:uncharacterized protein YndB with AHSA1/START domain